MKKGSRKTHQFKPSKSSGSYLNQYLTLFLTVGVLVLVLFFSSLEPDDLEAVNSKFSEFVKMLVFLSKKALTKDSGSDETGPNAQTQSLINFSSFDRGSSIIKMTKQIASGSSLLRNDQLSLLFPMRVVREQPVEFIVVGIEDFYLQEVIFKTEDFYTNYPSRIDIFTSIDQSEDGWLWGGSVSLRDKEGVYSHSLDQDTLCRFVKVVIRDCHDNFRYYNCSLNNLKLRGKTISEKKLDFGKNIRDRITTSTANAVLLETPVKAKVPENTNDPYHDLFSFYWVKILKIERNLELSLKKIEGLLDKRRVARREHPVEGLSQGPH